MSFILPDLVSSCPFEAKIHHNGAAIGDASDKWLEESCPGLTEEQHCKIYATQGGMLGGFAYPYCDDERLRISADCLNILFYLDDISDRMLKNETERLADAVMNAMWFPDIYRPTRQEGKEQAEQEIAAARLCRDFWRRFIPGAESNTQARLLEHMDMFLSAAHKEGRDRRDGIIIDLDSYVVHRRYVSANRVMFDCIEYALGIELPDSVASDPIMQALNDGANDIIAWDNDMASFNVEQARGHISNIVTVLMAQHGIDLQTAMDLAGDLRNQAIDKFREHKAKLPSWGPGVDRDVAAYIRGLEFCCSGHLHWSFATARYHGKQGAQVRETRLVTLLPKQVPVSVV